VSSCVFSVSNLKQRTVHFYVRTRVILVYRLMIKWHDWEMEAEVRHDHIAKSGRDLRKRILRTSVGRSVGIKQARVRCPHGPVIDGDDMEKLEMGTFHCVSFLSRSVEGDRGQNTKYSGFDLIYTLNTTIITTQYYCDNCSA